jgi:hypothetical protein
MKNTDICSAIDEITHREPPTTQRDWTLQQLDEELRRRVQERLWVELQERKIDPTRLDDYIHPHTFMHRPEKARVTSWASFWELIRLAQHNPGFISDKEICSAIEMLTMEQHSLKKQWALGCLERELEWRVRKKLELAIKERATKPWRHD